MKALLGVWIGALAAAAVWIGWDAYQGGKPAIGGPFALTDQDGRTVTSDSLKGKPTLIYFGFTYCPDVCPTTLQTLLDAKAKLGARAEKLQIVFVSVDPGRDTPQQVTTYLSNFPGVVGLTGSPEQVAQVTKAYKVYASLSCPAENPADRAKLKAPQDCPDSYLVDHTSAVYLMDPKGRFANAVAHQLGPDQAADVIAREMEKQGD
jgi:cytochrome oxidase Cu insertion factor (SCO1/SenC/PrrC family)